MEHPDGRSIVVPVFGVDSSKTNVGSVRIFPVIVNLVSQSKLRKGCCFTGLAGKYSRMRSVGTPLPRRTFRTDS